jgi:hypothetical protein
MLESSAITSNLVVDATVTAVEIQAGALTPFVAESLPAEITVATPAVRKVSIANFRTSVSQYPACGLPPLRLMLTEANLTPLGRLRALV